MNANSTNEGARHYNGRTFSALEMASAERGTPAWLAAVHGKPVKERAQAWRDDDGAHIAMPGRMAATIATASAPGMSCDERAAHDAEATRTANDMAHALDLGLIAPRLAAALREVLNANACGAPADLTWRAQAERNARDALAAFAQVQP